VRDACGDVHAHTTVCLDDLASRLARRLHLRVARIVELVPCRAAGLARDRLREVVLVPRGRLWEELLAALVRDARATALQL
jgi:hypothetical protein